MKSYFKRYGRRKAGSYGRTRGSAKRAANKATRRSPGFTDIEHGVRGWVPC